MLAFFQRVAEAIAEGKPGVVLTVMRAEGVENQQFIDPLEGSPRMIILGGGHIAQPLATMASLSGFSVTLVDDRPIFAYKERFPTAEQVICATFSKALAEMAWLANTYVVIVTRGHRWDEECLRGVIEKPLDYLGMIGSLRRVKAVLEKIVEEGFSSEAAESVHSPIGLNIGAQTPAEIAISIMAEIINQRRGGKAAIAAMKRRL